MNIDSSLRRPGKTQLLALVLGVLAAIIAPLFLITGPAKAAAQQQGGPLILMGIDAEDGGPGGHGPITNYQDVVNNILSQTSNNGSGILVIGAGGANDGFYVDPFWDAVAQGTGESVTKVSDASNIAAQSFSGFKMIAVVSDENNTYGGLTQAENDALAARQPDIASFVNSGGGLLGFSSDFSQNSYGYLEPGAFASNIGLGYNDITPTAEGLAIGITDALDICCWHDEYVTFPSFLKVLATNPGTGNAAAVGGANVVVVPTDKEVPVDVKPTSCRNPLNVNDQGTLPAAILGTQDFDVTQIKPDSVKLEGVEPKANALEDVATPFEPYIGKKDANDCTTAGADGFQDLTLKFDAQKVVSALGTTADGEVRVLKLTGELNDGTSIVGEDVVVTLKKK